MLEEEMDIGGVIEAPDERRKTTDAKTLVFTCAQNNTRLHDGFWGALMGYCKDRGAELHVSRFTYNKASYGKKSVKPGSQRRSDFDDLWYDARIIPFASDTSVQITPDLVWCGELNIIPTRKLPLSTMKTYTRQASGIIPHVKMHMESVPTMKYEPARFLYTTGAVTQRNYIQKAAGQEADFHHVFGALVVEIDEDGEWFVRQLNADKTGGFYDLTTYYRPYDGHPVPDQRVQAITHGDIHLGKGDPSIDTVVWSGTSDRPSVVAVLKPREQFIHDLVDFTARNHHEIKKWRAMADRYHGNKDHVRQEFEAANTFLWNVAKYSNDCSIYVVESNHDTAIDLWLGNTDALKDAVNADFWIEMNYLMRLDARYEGLTAFQSAMKRTLWGDPVYTILAEDTSYKILGEIEAALHGHLGPNGARGNPKNLRTVGKANTGHTHSAGIVDGVYTAGVYGNLDMGYNKGLSSWSNSMVVTYANAKRAVLTIKNGRAWR